MSVLPDECTLRLTVKDKVMAALEKLKSLRFWVDWNTIIGKTISNTTTIGDPDSQIIKFDDGSCLLILSEIEDRDGPAVLKLGGVSHIGFGYGKIHPRALIKINLISETDVEGMEAEYLQAQADVQKRRQEWDRLRKQENDERWERTYGKKATE